MIAEKKMVGKTWKNSAINISTLAAIFLFSLPGNAQEEEEHAHNKYAIAAFVGGTHVGGTNEFTLGIEGGYAINSTWSIGGVLERSERGESSTLILLGVGWHPIGPTFRLQLAAGRKDPSGHTENVVRTGIAYELEMENNWFIKPYLAIDFISHEENEEVFGIYIGRSF